MMHGMLGKCYRWCHHKSIGLLLLRLSLGSFFIAHGVNKFQNMEVVGTFFTSIGLGTYWVTVVALVEVLGGLALVLGAFTWVAAAALTIEMAVAIYTVTGPNVSQQPALTQFISSWGPNVIYATAALCIAFCGSGRYSLTAWYLRRKGMDNCKDCTIDHGVQRPMMP